MTVEQLRVLGLSDEQTEAVLSINTTDIDIVRAELNKKVSSLEGDIRSRDEQLQELKKVNPEQLQEKIRKLEEENATSKKEYEATLKQERIKAEVDRVLRKYHCKNPKMLAPYVDYSKITISDDGREFYGVDDLIKPLTEGEETAFAFELGRKPIGREPIDGGDLDDLAKLKTQKISDMAYEEFLKHFNSKNI